MKKQIIAENNFYANMLALAERAWLGGGSCYFDGPQTLLRTETPDSNQDFADFERRMLWHKHHTFQKEAAPMSGKATLNGELLMLFPIKAI